MQRWITFIICALVAGAILGAATHYFVPPIQRMACDPENVLQSQTETVDLYAYWLWRNLILLAGLTALLTASSFYLQILRRLKQSASYGRLLLCVLGGWFVGWMVVNVAAGWAARQTGSCLIDALRVPVAARRMTFSDVVPQLGRPDAWRYAMSVDMAVIVLVGGLCGVLIYWSSWRAFKL
jgi:hypothetical protein